MTYAPPVNGLMSALKAAGYGKDYRALKALCERYDVPVRKLNKRQFAITEADYQLLLERMSQKKEAA